MLKLLKMSLKFCSNLSFMFTENSNILERYHLASTAGFKAVESAYPKGFTIDEVVTAKNKANVQQVLLNLYVEDGHFGYAAIPGKEQAFKESLSKTIQLAKALQCPKIHLTAGTVTGPITDVHHDTYLNNLKYAVKMLEMENIMGVIEPINPYSLPNYYLTDYNRAISIIKSINSKNLRLQLDIFHLQHLRGNLTNSIKSMMPYTGHVQVAQVPSRGEPNSDGEINYQYIFSLLEKEGYRDWIGLEYKPINLTESGLSWITQMGFKL